MLGPLRIETQVPAGRCANVCLQKQMHQTRCVLSLSLSSCLLTSIKIAETPQQRLRVKCLCNFPEREAVWGFNGVQGRLQFPRETHNSLCAVDAPCHPISTTCWPAFPDRPKNPKSRSPNWVPYTTKGCFRGTPFTGSSFWIGRPASLQPGSGGRMLMSNCSISSKEICPKSGVWGSRALNLNPGSAYAKSRV